MILLLNFAGECLHSSRAECAGFASRWSRRILQPGSDVDDRSRSPLAATRGRQAALVERLRGGVRALASELGQDLAELLRARVSLPAYGLDALLPHLGSERNRTVRVAELEDARLCGSEHRHAD